MLYHIRDNPFLIIRGPGVELRGHDGYGRTHETIVKTRGCEI